MAIPEEVDRKKALMTKISHGERDYAFGQLMLTLRTATGLTQMGLADLLGVSRHAVGGWESGQSYPKAEHLQSFIVLGLQQHIFAAGRETEEIRDFWRAAHQKVLLDESWLQGLLYASPMPASANVVVEPPSTDLAKEPALWTVPYARNPHFTGRDDLLDQLHQRLAPPSSDQPTAMRRTALTQAQVIKGLGGIGKTQTAVEYAYRSREQDRYAHTLWIAAVSEESILVSFSALADLLPDVVSRRETDQRKRVTAIIQWLEQCPQPWLLIADNADDLSLVHPYLPVKGNGSVLITTRASATGWLASSLDVAPMGVMEGTELLLRRALRFDQASDDEINEAINLVIALGQFPLAIDQAGAYIEETGCSVADYLQIYQTHRPTLLARRGRQATKYPASVSTTWSLSFQYVEETNPAAAELLRLCALLSPDHIPEELFTEGISLWPLVLQQAVADRFLFNQMLETLLAFSLVKRLSEDHLLSIHRLVQAVQIERLSQEERHQRAEQLVRAINSIFPRDPQEVSTWSRCQRYLEQVQACDRLIREQQLLLSEGADLLDRAGTSLRARALYALAEPLYQQALQVWEQQGDQIGRARSLNHLAELAFWQDKPVQAEALYNQALVIREQQLGAEHRDVAESSHGLAGLYRMQGKYTEAEAHYTRALGIWEQQFGADHPMTAETIHGLAVLYKQQGKYAQSEPLYLRALAIREQQLGPEHLLVAESSNDLSVLYRQQGKYAQSEPLTLRALHIWKRQLGPQHLMVAYPLINLAVLYRDQERYAEAEQFYLDVLHIWEQQWGPEHRNVAFALSGLAETYRRQGNYAEAEPLYLRALHIREQRLGPEHPLLAVTLNGLANLFSMQGRLTEAEQFYQRALLIRKQHFGPEHTDVAQSLRDIANHYTRQRRYAEAEPLYVQVISLYERLGEIEHLERANTLDDFASFQQVRGHIEQAACLYQQALVIREQALGADASLTIITRERFHAIQHVLNQTPELTETSSQKRNDDDPI